MSEEEIKQWGKNSPMTGQERTSILLGMTVELGTMASNTFLGLCSDEQVLRHICRLIRQSWTDFGGKEKITDFKVIKMQKKLGMKSHFSYILKFITLESIKEGVFIVIEQEVMRSDAKAFG